MIRCVIIEILKTEEGTTEGKMTSGEEFNFQTQALNLIAWREHVLHLCFSSVWGDEHIIFNYITNYVTNYETNVLEFKHTVWYNNNHVTFFQA